MICLLIVVSKVGLLMCRVIPNHIYPWKEDRDGLVVRIKR